MRGETDLTIGGGPDILRAVYSHNNGDGNLIGNSGDGLFFFVKWDKNGKGFSESIHQYGSATARPESPHYDDQAHLFVMEKMKSVWRVKSEILKHVEAEYSPGKYLSDYQFRAWGTARRNGATSTKTVSPSSVTIS